MSEQWQQPPSTLALLSQDIHVWRVSLALPQKQACQFTPLLSPDERLKADRFRQPIDRLRFVVGRGVLRIILGRYLAIAPGQLRFAYSSYGKPSLADSASGLEFSVSHAQDMALYAVGRDRLLGIDLEWSHREVNHLESIAERFFSAAEHQQLMAFPPEQRQTAFLQLWTCKEAYLKAIGIGLSGLEQSEVFFSPPHPLQLRHHPHWHLQSFTPSSGYIATLAAKGVWQAQYWEFKRPAFKRPGSAE